MYISLSLQTFLTFAVAAEYTRARHRNRIPRITVAVLRFRLRADRPLTPVGRITDTGLTATVWAVPYTAVYGCIRLYGLYRVRMDSGTVFGSKTTYEGLCQTRECPNN